MDLWNILKKLDLAPLGLERRTDAVRYICTPIGARILWNTGVDGIHYCTIRDQGETVFCVEPENGPGDCVHPVAASLADFVGLLLACGEESPICQCWLWDREQFDEFLSALTASPEQQAALQALAGRTGFSPIEDPYGYIRALQEGFAESDLRFGREYAAALREKAREAEVPAWKVAFAGNFFSQKGRAGVERPLNVTFDWNCACWHVPAAYVCAEGLVIDALAEIDPGIVRDFLARFADLDESRLTPEEQEAILRDNPLNVEATASVILNGVVTPGFGTSHVWVPDLPEGERNDRIAGWVLDHYGLDRSRAWRLCRWHFPWGGKKPSLRSLALQLEADAVEHTAARFTVRSPGDEVTFSHPVTGESHTLTVHELTQETLPPAVGRFRCFTRLSYAIAPESDFRALSIVDASDADDVYEESIGLIGGADNHALSVIGGPDGPTAMFVASAPAQPHLRAACSRPRLRHEEHVQWRAVFQVKPCGNAVVKLI